MSRFPYYTADGDLIQDPNDESIFGTGYMNKTQSIGRSVRSYRSDLSTFDKMSEDLHNNNPELKALWEEYKVLRKLKLGY